MLYLPGLLPGRLPHLLVFLRGNNSENNAQAAVAPGISFIGAAASRVQRHSLSIVAGNVHSGDRPLF